MASENEIKLLDDYLANRLSGQEKTAFEQQLQGNPELQQELKFQQELIEGIRKARIAELKAMLNNVPVPPVNVGTTSVAVKVISTLAVVGVVSTAVYFYFNEPQTKQTPTPAETTEQNVTANSPKEPVISEESNTPSGLDGKNTSKVPDNTIKKETAPVAQPKLEVYNPETEADHLQTDKEHAQLDIISRAFVTSSIEVEIEKSIRKYNFHYMFKDNKLVLFGSFEDHLYEILEFIAGNQRTVVLYYNSLYYLLDTDKSAPTQLVPIKDKALLSKLQQYRGH
jgi:hypothetical protein